jgi:hypothetical protein
MRSSTYKVRIVFVVGTKVYVVGGSILESGQQIRSVEYFDTERGEWEEDFRFRKGAYV